MGRYIQSDPLGLPALLSDGPSVYGYVGGNPFGYVDPSGQFIQLIPLISGALASMTATDAVIIGSATVTAAVVGNYFKEPATYQTYTRYNPVTHQCYSGRTSGRLSPEKNVTMRMYGPDHVLRTLAGYEPPILDRSSPKSPPIRGREQQLIDINGGAITEGGHSGNVTPGIRRGKERKRLEALATLEFGVPVPADRCTCQ